VQPHSGASANIGMYFALLQPGDTVLGMDLSHGGHLTHGHPVTYITKFFNFVRYKMKNTETGEIDYEDMRRVALETKPKIVLGGYSAYSRELDYQKMADIAKEVGAYAVMDAAHIAGLIAGGVAKNPFDYGFDVITSTTHKTLRGPRGGLILTRDSEEIAKKVDKAVFPGLQGGPLMHVIAGKAVAFGEALQPSFKNYTAQILTNAKAMEEVFRTQGVRMLGGGTSNHLILADVFGSLGIPGKEAEEVLDRVGITLNKNVVADDPRGPMDPSGIRFGTPAITTRKLGEKECARVAELMIDALKNRADAAKLDTIHNEIKTMCEAFPIPDSFM
jgi:glycine hydroxymethyltransferase